MAMRQDESAVSVPVGSAGGSAGRLRWARGCRLVVIGLLGSVTVLLGCSGGDDVGIGRPSVAPVPRVPAPSGPNTPVVWDESVPDPQPRDTPADAVSAFLTAEIDGDLAASFAVLSSDERTAIGGIAPWVARHAQLPVYLSFQVLDSTGDGTVTTDVTAVPRLDEIVGYMPSRARVVWTTVDEGAGWTVALDRTVADAVPPDDSGAEVAALEWTGAVTSGGGADEFEYAGNLLGQPEIVDRLAGSDNAAFTAGSTSMLRDWPSAAVVTNAFGPAAAQWARVVSLDGPLPIDVVTAPMGDRWLVVGVVAR